MWRWRAQGGRSEVYREASLITPLGSENKRVSCSCCRKTSGSIEANKCGASCDVHTRSCNNLIANFILTIKAYIGCATHNFTRA